MYKVSSKNLPAFLFALGLGISAVNAQTPFRTMDSLDINNITASVLVHGDMWWDPPLGVSACEFPAHSGKSVNFASALWMSGYDGSGQLHIAAQTYRQSGNDYWPGPLYAGDTLTYATSYSWAKIWKVNRTDVQTFLSSALHTIASTPGSILTWPGKGNVYAQGNSGAALTITTDMAPFVDLNGNGIYEPLEGEYPAFPGDQALWWVFSDNGPSHNSTRGKPLGVEVHALSYGYRRGTLIDDVVYYEYDIVNRSANDYSNFRVAQWDDIDLGYYLDDFIGFDSIWRMGIGYNGTSCDGCNAGSPENSYGADPPQSAVTMIVLPGDNGTDYVPVGNFTYYNNDYSVIGIPTVDTEYNNYMRGKITNGRHFADDFTGPGIPATGFDSGFNANYVYPGDPSNPSQWSECISKNNPGDRRFILSSNDFILNSGASQKIVMALMVADSAGGCGATSFNNIRIVADTAWSVYHNSRLSVQNVPADNGLKIYPNPAHDKIFIENFGIVSNEESITIRNVLGQSVHVSIAKSGKIWTADLTDLPNGLYILQYRNGDQVTKIKFLKE